MSIVENPSGAGIFLRSPKGAKVLGVWKGKRDGVTKEWYELATKSAEVAEAYHSGVKSIRNNAELSDIGKANAIKALATENLKLIGKAGKRAAETRKMIYSQYLPLTPFRPYDSTNMAGAIIQAMQDIALAQTYRASSGADRTRMDSQVTAGTAPELAAALLRTPQTISGVSDNILTRVKGRGIEQLHAGELEKRQEIEAQDKVLGRAIDEAFWQIADDAELSWQERREFLGDAAEHFVMSRNAPDRRTDSADDDDTDEATADTA